MTLFDALRILAEVHTSADMQTGFDVEMGAMPEHYQCSKSDYVEAWRVIREQLNLVTEPLTK